MPGLCLNDMWQRMLGRVDVLQSLKSTPGAIEIFRPSDVVDGTVLSRHLSLVGEKDLDIGVAL